jgi:putative aminopeptidase FrvX
MNLNSNLLKILQEIQEVPSSPFLPKPQKRFVKSFLKKNQIPFTEDSHSIIANPVKNPSAPKLVFLTHLDHPGFVLKNNKEGIAFGSVGLPRLKKKLPIPLKIYSPSGKFIGKGHLSRIKGRNISTEIDFDVPINSFAQYDIPYFSETSKSLKLYNADNAIDTAVLLHLLTQKLNSKFDLYFVFNFHEEVHQISAWSFSKRNPLGIGTQDIVVNLEAPIIENQKNKYLPSVNYLKGPVLKLSNIDLVFGYKNPGVNMAETLLKTVSKRHKLPLQVGITKGSDESRTITYFGLTPNIVTLAIPNRFKHNLGKSGQVVPESILKKDVFVFTKLLRKIVASSPNSLKKTNLDKDNMSQKLKVNSSLTNESIQLHKAQLNTRLAIYYRSVIKRGYYYPQTIFDHLQDLSLKLLFYLQFFVHHLNT